MLPHCHGAMLPCHHTVTLPLCRMPHITLPCHHAATAPHCHSATAPHRHATTLHITTLPHATYHTATPPCCHATTPPHVTPPHCHTATLPQELQRTPVAALAKPTQSLQDKASVSAIGQREPGTQQQAPLAVDPGLAGPVQEAICSLSPAMGPVLHPQPHPCLSSLSFWDLCPTSFKKQCLF